MEFSWISFLLGIGLMAFVTSIALVLIAVRGNSNLIDVTDRSAADIRELFVVRQQTNDILRELVKNK